MIATINFAPFVGMVGGGFLAGLITGWAIKKIMRLAAVIVGLFMAVLAYLEYQRILNVDWDRIQIASQNDLVWISNIITHISNVIGGPHSGTFSHVGIPVASASAGLAIGIAKG